MLSLEDFKDAIDKIKILLEREEKFNKVIEEISFDGYAYIYQDSITWMIDLLSKAMDDRETQWIEYWIWELNMGKDWRPGSVTEGGPNFREGRTVDMSKPHEFAPGEKDIKLETIEDLYNLLMEKTYDRER